MSSEKVLSDEILSDAKRKADRTRKRAEREASGILTQAKAQADEGAERTLGLARQRGERQAQAILATVETEVQRGLLEARERELDKLFQVAQQRLAGRESYDYPAAVAALAAEAIQAMGTDHVVLELSEADHALVSDAWFQAIRECVGRDVGITVAPEAAAIDGGVLVRSADGRLLYDNSFGARLQRLRPELRRELAAKLFGDTGGTPVPPPKAGATGP